MKLLILTGAMVILIGSMIWHLKRVVRGQIDSSYNYAVGSPDRSFERRIGE